MPVRLVGDTLAEVFTNELPARLIGDKAYDSDPLDAELIEQDIEMTSAAQTKPEKSSHAGRSKTAPL